MKAAHYSSQPIQGSNYVYWQSEINYLIMHYAMKTSNNFHYDTAVRWPCYELMLENISCLGWHVVPCTSKMFCCSETTVSLAGTVQVNVLLTIFTLQQ